MQPILANGRNGSLSFPQMLSRLHSQPKVAQLLGLFPLSLKPSVENRVTRHLEGARRAQWVTPGAEVTDERRDVGTGGALVIVHNLDNPR